MLSSVGILLNLFFNLDLCINALHSVLFINGALLPRIHFFKNPKHGTNILHNLHVQPVGLEHFISCLNFAKDVISFIDWGTCFHNSGPRYVIVSVPYITGRTFSDSQIFLFLKLYGISCWWKISQTIFGHKLFFTLYINVASVCKFRSCIVNVSSLCSNVSDEVSSLYVTLRALSCNLLILLLKGLLWNSGWMGERVRGGEAARQRCGEAARRQGGKAERRQGSKAERRRGGEGESGEADWLIGWQADKLRGREGEWASGRAGEWASGGFYEMKRKWKMINLTMRVATL